MKPGGFHGARPFASPRAEILGVHAKPSRRVTTTIALEPVSALALRIAESVVEQTRADRPADELLRTALRGVARFRATDAAAAAGAVFACFRWWRWLPAGAPVRIRVQKAIELARQYAVAPGSFSDDDLRRAIPEWVEEQVEVLPAWLRLLQVPPTLWLRARSGEATALAERLGDCTPVAGSRSSEALKYGGATDLFRTTDFHAGNFEIQDIHSQAIGWICGPQPGQTWWDACAGQGGKMLHLSDLMQGKGLLWASDRSVARLDQLRRRAARARVFNYRASFWGGGTKLPTKTKFDGVLLDAPCTNIGTWQRNPHARWSIGSADVDELAARQIELLGNASTAVKPGGKLVYSVCTLSRAETVSVAELFEDRHPEFKPISISDPFEENGLGASRLWLRPEKRSANGMFVAAWQRLD